MTISFFLALLLADKPSPPTDAATVRAVWLADLDPATVKSGTVGRWVFVPGSRAEIVCPEESSLRLMEQLASAGSTPSQELSREEQARRVREAVAALSEADREILLLRNFEGLSFEEVSCLLGIEGTTARQRHGRALIRLTRLLGRET